MTTRSLARRRFVSNLRRDAVRGQDHHRALGYVVDLFDEDRASSLEAVHDVKVVHDLASNVDGRAKLLERSLTV